MIWLLLLLVISYSLTPGSYRTVDVNNQPFSHTFYRIVSAPNCNSVQPPPSLSCTLTILHGSSTSTFNGGCSWNLQYCVNLGNNSSVAYYVCNVNIPTSNLQPGYGWANLTCNNNQYTAISDPLLFDFRDPKISNFNIQPNSPFYQDYITVSYCVDDDNDDILCKIKVNGIVFTETRFPGKQGCDNKTISGLPWGNHIIRVECNDTTRNQSFNGTKRKDFKETTVKRYTAQTAMVIILSPPQYPIFATNNTTTKPVNITFEVSNSPTDLLDCIINNTDTGLVIDTINDVRNNSRISRIYYNLTEGLYNIRVQCTDRGPRNTGQSDLRTFIVDYTPPAINIIYPEEGSNLFSTPINFKIKVLDTIKFPNVLTCKAVISGAYDNTFNNINPNSTISFDVSNINDGNYTFNVTCKDLAQNQYSTGIRFVYKDGVPPKITPLSPIGRTVQTNSVQLSAKVVDTSSYICKFFIEGPNGYSNSAQSSGSGSSILNVNINLGDDGEYRWKVNCSDSSTSSESDWVTFRKNSQISLPPFSISCGGNSRMLNIFAAVAVIGILLISLGYLFGNIFNNQEILLGAKAELRSFLVTLLIFALITFASNAFYCNMANNMIESAKQKISDLSRNITDTIMSTARIYGMASILSSISPMEWSISIWVVELNKRENFNKKIYDCANNAQAILKLFQSIIFNLNYYTSLVVFLMSYSYGFLLYLALIARILPFTKRIGSTLLGIAITLIFILPFVYYISTTILVDILLSILDTVNQKIVLAETKIGEIYNQVVAALEALNDLAVWTNRLQFGWLFLKFGAWIFLQISKIIGITYPIAAALFYVYADLAYGIIKMILAIIWGLQTNNLNNIGTGGTNQMIEAFEILLSYDTTLLLAFINLINIIYYVLNLLIAILAVRSISLLGGGDYFLYGIEERI